jgi:deoxyadenosine/deoxycytidine kinase
MKIVIDGNIGAGKTTQLNFLKNMGARVFKEPIEEWPLKEFYEDPKRGIFPLQMAVLRTVCDQGARSSARDGSSGSGPRRKD